MAKNRKKGRKCNKKKENKLKLGGEIGKGRERAAKLQNGSARTHKVLVTGHAGLRNRGHTCAVGRSQSASLREKKESTLIEQLRNEKRKKEKKEKKRK